jgi:hypothetical protein
MAPGSTDPADRGHRPRPFELPRHVRFFIGYCVQSAHAKTVGNGRPQSQPARHQTFPGYRRLMPR